MRRGARRQLFAIALVVGGCGCLTAFGCSLGLDKSLLSREGGTSDGSEVETSTDGPPLVADGQADAPGDHTGSDSMQPGVDAPADAPMSPDAGSCHQDQDCAGYLGDAGTAACVHSVTCNTTTHLCSLDVCPTTAACQESVCNAKAGKCSAPKSYPFASGSFSVTTGGVAGAPRQSIAAVWPFVFVATTNGVAVLDVFDPTTTAPTTVTLHGVPFVASAVIAVGPTVYFVTGDQGVAPNYRQAVAWVNVPDDPFTTDLYATSAWVVTTASPLDLALSTGAGLLLVSSSSALFPTTLATAPLSDPTSLTAYPNTGLMTGASIGAVSGTRLVSYRYDGTTTFNPFFAVVKNAGTASAQAGAEVQVSSLGTVDSQIGLGAGDDGSVLWETAVTTGADAGTPTIVSANLSWLLSSSTDNGPGAASPVLLTTYSPALASGAVVGAPAWVDANTALALSVPPSAVLTNTLAQVATKKPAALTSGRSALLPVGPGSVGVATSNGFAYALLDDDPMNQTCTVQILAPACDASGGGD